mmetsp:Transcript_58419/g.153834  ORF Transcript_58419/g.153834 Transcript_58419/m.153834 type:complete len:661 (+) Transcript_58419:301-2283(+)
MQKVRAAGRGGGGRAQAPTSLSDLRAGSLHGGRALGGEVDEVLLEESGEVGRRLLELLRGPAGLHPGLLGAQDLLGHVLDGVPRHLQAEDRHRLPLGVRERRQRAVVDGVDELPRVLDAAAAAGAVGAAHPAGVHEVRVGAVLLELGGEHLGVDEGVPHEEGRAEAGGEGRLGLLHALLRAGHLGGVAGDEVVHDLVLSQLRDRGQHAEGVAGQKDDLLRVELHLGRDARVRDELQRVRDARVLREGDIVVVHFACRVVPDHVLEHGAKADRVVDLRLLLAREADGLGVAAALDVEDALRVPDVLVVSDEVTLGVGAEGRLPRAREAEEDGHVVVRPDVRRGVQREGALGRGEVALWHEGHHVVHDGEDPLLHLAGVLGPEDHHLAPLEGDGDRGRGGHAAGLPVGREDARVEDHKGFHVPVRELLDLLGRGRHQHVLHEEGVVRAGRDDAHRDAVVLVPATPAVDDVEALPRVQVVDSPLPVREEGLVLQLDVDLAPPDVVGGSLLEHDALVERGAARLLAALHGQGARGDDGAALLVLQRLLVEDAGGRVVVDLLDVQAQRVDLLRDLLRVDAERADLHGERRLHLLRAPALELGRLELLHQLRLDRLRLRLLGLRDGVPGMAEARHDRGSGEVGTEQPGTGSHRRPQGPGQRRALRR